LHISGQLEFQGLQQLVSLLELARLNQIIRLGYLTRPLAVHSISREYRQRKEHPQATKHQLLNPIFHQPRP